MTWRDGYLVSATFGEFRADEFEPEMVIEYYDRVGSDDKGAPLYARESTTFRTRDKRDIHFVQWRIKNVDKPYGDYVNDLITNAVAEMG